MRKFFERCEELWMRQPPPAYWLKHFRNESQSVVFPAFRMPGVARLASGTATERAAASSSTEFPRSNPGCGWSAMRLVSPNDSSLFQESRLRLVRLALAASPATADLVAALQTFLEARRDFVVNTSNCQRISPLAVASFWLG